MRRLRLLSALVSLPLCSGALAQTAFVGGYDCWIGNSGGVDTTHYIRCIADSDDLTGPVPDGELVLDRIHSLLHRSAVDEVERIVRSDPLLLSSGRVRSVLLISYPAEWSWEEGLLHKLVSSAWCAATASCRISMFRR